MQPVRDVAPKVSLGQSIRFVLFVNGMLLLLLAAAMLVPMLIDLASDSIDWHVFALSAMVTGFVGAALVAAMRQREPQIEMRTGFLLTVTSWTVLCAFATLPLAFSSLHLSFTDAFFETMSALTTTGSTVLSGLDTMPWGLLLWRSLLQWLGGIGIVVMAIVILPFLRIGGMQLFRTESSDISGKPVARVVQMTELTVAVYVGLTAACAIGFIVAGMPSFDAVNHAMTTIATGGLSIKDASLGYYHSLPIELVAIVFMTAGALPLIWYAELLRDRSKALQETQVRVFIAVLCAAIVLMTTWNMVANTMDIRTALRLSAFNVTSVLTDTGFATTDFSAWGGFAVGLFFLLMLVGGCAGSTSGAIKIFRWQILFSSLGAQLKQAISPHRVVVTRYAGRTVDSEMVDSVRNFFFMYVITLLVLSLLVMATGPDFLSATSAVAQAMANAGPGLSPAIGPAGNFAGMSDPAKWLLALAMLLGRLELSTVYILLLVDYWRR
ncbi:trk system potassium uptake protein TrkH [Breoghania corrubedonensis]|uniref:Trk system potassium uptake protein n=1 Tax=Breoghania corrubedonensis TaxID=665038 RepID=A0A2T5VEJ8_9HYPH|nr:TrkH family potassium uptake protein [Breoghania corrubedonensis]PTW62184.1 trk system potassium uptake protein TrkH [Breoghania corrubedonensis]